MEVESILNELQKFCEKCEYNDLFICTKYPNGRCPEFIEFNKSLGIEDNKNSGIKYDSNKPRLAEMMLDFAPELKELCKVWEFGANKYSKSNWKKLDNGEDRYSNALLRHLIATLDNDIDDESHLLHASHMVFNALAYLHFVLERVNNNGNNKGTNDERNKFI